MSHYGVAVFSDDADFNRLLKPYNESNKDEYEFEPVDYEEIVKDYEKFKTLNPHYTLDDYIKVNSYIQQDGQWGYNHNPHGYYDYYTLDGKSYLFELRNPENRSGPYGFYRKNDYDWYTVDPDIETDAAEFWDTYIGENAIEEPPGIMNRQWYLDRYKTKEQYIMEECRTVPYAFITPDGVWHAPGVVGWFATSNDTAESFNKYLKEWDAFIAGDTNPYVSLVDCHI